MFGWKRKSGSDSSNVAESGSSGVVSTGIVVELANPPARQPVMDAGVRGMLAEQAARNFVASAAIDPVTTAAAVSELPPVRTIRSRGDRDIATVAVETIEASAVGDVLINGAESGEKVPPLPGAPVTSLFGIRALVEVCADRLAQARQAHEESAAVLRKEREAPGGGWFPGEPIDSEETGDLRRSIRWAKTRMLLIMAVLILIEGAVVTGNQIAYLRLPASQSWQGIAIAVVALAMVTVAPFLVGRWLAPWAHHGKLSRGKIAGISILAAFWLTSAISLALVRVSVDRAHAVQAAEERYQVALTNYQRDQLGARPTPVDPNLVFDPTLPIVMWVAILVGMGVLMCVFEMFHNPFRLEELKCRHAVRSLEERMVGLNTQQDAIERSIGVETMLKESAIAMWQEMPELITEGVNNAVDVTFETMATASGDADMTLAIERHRQEVARRNAASQSEDGAGA